MWCAVYGVWGVVYRGVACAPSGRLKAGLLQVIIVAVALDVYTTHLEQHTPRTSVLEDLYTTHTPGYMGLRVGGSADQRMGQS